MLVASITDSITNAIGDSGVYAVFGLMALDAVFPAASELVMVYGGAVAAGERELGICAETPGGGRWCCGCGGGFSHGAPHGAS